MVKRCGDYWKSRRRLWCWIIFHRHNNRVIPKNTMAKINASNTNPDNKIFARLKSMCPCPKWVIAWLIWCSTPRIISWSIILTWKILLPNQNPRYRIGTRVKGLVSQARHKLTGKFTSNSNTVNTIKILWNGKGSMPQNVPIKTAFEMDFLFTYQSKGFKVRSPKIFITFIPATFCGEGSQDWKNCFAITRGRLNNEILCLNRSFRDRSSQININDQS